MRKEVNSVTIIGGGPAGLKTAIELLKRNFKGSITIFEEDKEIGKPTHCAGLVSLDCINMLDQNIPRTLIVNRIKGAKIFFPNNRELIVSKNRYIAAVIDRENLDKYLAEQAMLRGANLVKGIKVCDLDIVRHKLLLSNKETHSFNTLVIASGVKERLTKKLGLRELKGKLPALQWDMVGVKDLDPKIVEIYLGSRFSEGLFAWIIPLDEGKARVGVATLKDPLSRLTYMVTRHPLLSQRSSHAKRIKTYGGAVITLEAKRKIVKDNVSLIGDIAGQTKPTTGGGLYYLSLAASYLADAISKNCLGFYEKMWKKAMEKELKIQLALRLFLNNLNDNALISLYKILKDTDFERIASVKGDMDFQSNIIGKLMLSGLGKVLLNPQLLFPLVSALAGAIF
ncbi:MAG TPA: NAD(P)/FAD-dependent oxidoreductase [Thermofilum sp.]|nr:NAD(P)/FAD-dependent oxidoreductase [Thermofilum sp.]